MNILIVNMGNNGDVLNSTPIAFHFKNFKKPNRVDFLTKIKYKNLLENNPSIDNVLDTGLELEDSPPKYHSHTIQHELDSYIDTSKYKKIFFSAPYMSQDYNDGFSDKSLLQLTKGVVKRWRCKFLPQVKLSPSEELEAQIFFAKLKGCYKVLVEYEFESNQSSFNYQYMNHICNHFQKKNIDIILTSKNKPEFMEVLEQHYDDINFYHYSNSFMSNAKLYNLVDLFVGCSSGLTCLTSSNYCDSNKKRIEVCNGPHWSTKLWSHNSKNKDICYNLESFKQSINNITI